MVPMTEPTVAVVDPKAPVGGFSSLPSSNGSGASSVRTILQRRALANVRRHGLRSFWRVTVLLLGDIAGLYLLRLSLDVMSTGLPFSLEFAGLLTRLLAVEFLAGWQFFVALTVGLAVTGSYGQGDRRHDAGRILVGSALAALFVLWSRLWSGDPGAVAVQLLAITVTTWVVITAMRAAVHAVVEAVRSRPAAAALTVLIGPVEACAHFARSPIFTRAYRLIGWLTPDGQAGRGVLGSYWDLAGQIARGGVDTVIVCGSLSDKDFAAVVDVSLTAGCQLLSFGRTLTAAGPQPTPTVHEGVPLVALTRPGLRAHQLVVKRTMDALLSLMAIIALAPLLAAIAIVIKATSKGPVFFRQARVGLGGREFRIFKFRSMRMDAEDLLESLREQSIYTDPRLFKIARDPRVTAVGAFLRRTSLDELPQLFNVLRGEMSLVGPRPPVPAEVAFYDDQHYCRFDVKPGITGPWQVNGRNLIRDFDEVVRLEREYIVNWSLLRDFTILLRTIPVVLDMRGAH